MIERKLEKYNSNALTVHIRRQVGINSGRVIDIKVKMFIATTITRLLT